MESMFWRHTRIAWSCKRVIPFEVQSNENQFSRQQLREFSAVQVALVRPAT